MRTKESIDLSKLIFQGKPQKLVNTFFFGNLAMG